MKRILPLLTLTASALTACGLPTERNGSETRQIATDMDGEAATEATYLYWVQGDSVFQGRCTVTPNIVDNCQDELRSLPLSAFSGALTSSILGSIEQLGASIAKLELKIPELAGTIAELTMQLASSNSDLQTREGEKLALDAELAGINKNIEALNAQIVALNAEISASPGNADLLALRNKRNAELNAETAKKNAVTPKVAQAAQALTSAASARDALALQQANVTFQYAASKSELKAAKDALVVAEGEKAAVDETLVRLSQSTIVYDVKAGETAFNSIRPFVARFKAIFDNGAEMSLDLTYDNLDLLIPATGTTGTVDFPILVSNGGSAVDVSLQYKMTHSSPSDLRISLIAPNGATVSLRAGASGTLNDYFSADGRTAVGFDSKTVNMAAFNNTPVKGTWTLRIQDASNGDAGKLTFVNMMLKAKAAAQ
jgi:subtilisin-like proprotein convertase family protein